MKTRDSYHFHKKLYISLHLGLRMGQNPDGDGGNKSPGDGGGSGRDPGSGPKIPGDNGEKEKLGVHGGGYWNPGDSSGYGDLGDNRFKNELGDGGTNCEPGDGNKPGCC